MTKIDVSKVKKPEDMLKVISELPPEVIAEFGAEKVTKERLTELAKKYFASEDKKKEASNKGKSPEAAKKIFEAYKKKHPSTTKKWDDFYEKGDGKGGDSKDDKGGKKTLSKEDAKAISTVTKQLNKPEIKKALSKPLHEGMSKIEASTENEAKKVMKDKGMMDKIKGGMRKHPMATRVALVLGMATISVGSILGASALWEKAALKVEGQFTDAVDRRDDVDDWSKHKMKHEINMGVATAQTMAGAGTCAAIGLAWIAGGVATDKIMHQLYDEEMRKPEEERDSDFIKHMEKTDGLLLKRKESK